MNDTTYTIKIKKEYASAILEDLKQVDAIEILEDPLPEWQKQESLRRLAEMKANLSPQISEEDCFRSLDTDSDEKI